MGTLGSIPEDKGVTIFQLSLIYSPEKRHRCLNTNANQVGGALCVTEMVTEVVVISAIVGH